MNSILIQLLAGTSGKPSSMRAALLCAVFISFSVWAVVCISKGQLFDLPEYIVWCIAALAGSKVWQRGKEEKPTTPVP